MMGVRAATVVLGLCLAVTVGCRKKSSDDAAPAPPPGTPSGGLITSFGSGGVITSDPSTRDDSPQAVVSDGTYLYIVGYDSVPGTNDERWRIEKRSAATGALDSGFGTGGVVTVDPSTGWDEAVAVGYDGTNLYIVGFDSSPGVADEQWRIEKRLMSTGALVTAFGTSGVVTSNPSTGFDEPRAVAGDGTDLYIVGYDESPGTGNSQWRIEKRSMSTGALVTAFGTSGVVTVNPSTTLDEATGVASDGTYLYIVGFDEAPGSADSEWRIEKRSLSTGALVTAFGSSGVVLSNPSTRVDDSWGVALDGTSLYAVGDDESPAAGDSRIRVEKRSMTSGALVALFGSGGVVTSNPSATFDGAASVLLDGLTLYVIGGDGSPGASDAQWRVEARNVTSGALVSGFGAGGAVMSNPSSRPESAIGAISDTTSLFLVGDDQTPGTGDYRWRVERRSK